jgi:hypothetical protein
MNARPNKKYKLETASGTIGGLSGKQSLGSLQHLRVIFLRISSQSLTHPPQVKPNGQKADGKQ